MKHRYLSLLICICLWGVEATYGQSFDLRLANECASAGFFSVDIEIKANGSVFDLGSSALYFDYNASVLGAPFLLTDYNYVGLIDSSLCPGGGCVYDEDYQIFNAVGRTGIGINLFTVSNGAEVPMTFTRILRLRFPILDSTGTVGIVWRSPSMVVAPTVIKGEDQITDITANVLSGLDIQPIDTIAPIITVCDLDTTLMGDAGVCGTVLTWSEPNFFDQCGIRTISVSDTSGSFFPVGATTVSYSIDDYSGNTASCSFVVTVTDVDDPTITCPADITQSNDAGMCAAVVTWDPPTVSDNCGSPTLTSSANSGDSFPLGTTSVSYTATDGDANSVGCSFNVTVTDDESPSLGSCPVDQTVGADAGNCSAVVMWTAPSPSDNCALMSVTSDGSSGDSFDLGTTTVSYTATDSAGNTAACSFNITVLDNEMPSLTACPSDISLSADVGTCAAAVTWVPPTSADNCALMSVSSTGNSGDSFAVGTTTVTYTATDSSSNTATCNFNITVTDDENPSFASCPTDVTTSTEVGSCDVVVQWSSIPIASDNCGVASVDSTHASGSVFSIGTTPVTYTVTDISGNTTVCAFSITVNDNQNPSMSCPADMTATTASGASMASVVVPVPTTSDNCSIASITNTYNAGSNASDDYPIGLTTVTFIATDVGGNTDNCSLNITVVDGSPTITCPSNISQGNDVGQCNAAVTVPQPTPGGSYPGSSIVNDYNNTSNASDTYPLGNTTVTFTLTDMVGTTASCSMTVSVSDMEAPIISACPDQTLSADGVGCTVSAFTDISYADNCVGATVSYSPGGPYAEGSNSITAVVIDAAANISTCNFTLLVEPSLTVDGGNDVVLCDDLTTTLNAMASGATGTVSYAWQAGSTNLGTNASLTVTIDSLTVYQVTATDDNCSVSDEVIVNAAFLGRDCENAHVVDGLSFKETGLTTQCRGNDYSDADACGSTYMNEADYVFSYTPIADQYVQVQITNSDLNVGVFVLDGCPDNGGTQCVGQANSPAGNPSLNNVSLMGGTTYYIVVSSLTGQSFTPFDIRIDSIAAPVCGRDAFEPNDVVSAAAPMPTIGIHRNAEICPVTDRDWFQYKVGTKRSIAVKLYELPENYDLWVYDSELSLLGSSLSLGTADERVVLNNLITGDTLYIEVASSEGAFSNESYNLHVQSRNVPFTNVSILKDDEGGKEVEEALGGIPAVSVYPNPTKGELFVRIDGGEGQAEWVLYDALGKLAIRETWDAQETPLHLIKLPKLTQGIYYYSLRIGNQLIQNKVVYE